MVLKIARHVVIAAALVLMVSAMQAGAQTSRPSTLSGTFRVHPNFHSKSLDNDRRLIVYLPPDYESHPQQRYGVFYMHDGQNLFDDATSFAGEWHADETAEGLIRGGKIAPIIIVGIDNRGAERTDEYTPTRDAARNAGGKGDAYAKFVVEEVKPFIDAQYRTLPDSDHSAIGGSSLGGLISLYIIQKHPAVFGKCAAVSPSLFWDDQQLTKLVTEDPGPLVKTRLWIDMGTAEGKDAAVEVVNCERLVGVLTRAGAKQGRDLQWRRIEGGEHNERAWSARFGEILEFLFPPEK